MVSTQMDLGIDLSGFGKGVGITYYEVFRALFTFYFGIPKHDLTNRELEKKHSSKGEEGKKPGSD